MFVLSCQTSKNVNSVSFKKFEKKNKTMANSVHNHSFFTEKDVGKSFSVKGKLFYKESNWVLLENPNSRSCVSFVLEVSKEVNSLLAENEGRIVTVVGTLTKVKDTWNKTIFVISIK